MMPHIHWHQVKWTSKLLTALVISNELDKKFLKKKTKNNSLEITIIASVLKNFETVENCKQFNTQSVLFVICKVCVTEAAICY